MKELLVEKRFNALTFHFFHFSLLKLNGNQCEQKPNKYWVFLFQKTKNSSFK